MKNKIDYLLLLGLFLLTNLNAQEFVNKKMLGINSSNSIVISTEKGYEKRFGEYEPIIDMSSREISYVFYENGNLKHEKYKLLKMSAMTLITKFYYDNNGNLEYSETYDREGVMVFHYKYQISSSRINKIDCYNEDMKLNRYIKYEYDNKGNLTKLKYEELTGEITRIESFSYDENNMLSQKTIEIDGKKTVREYDYDKNGDWKIRKISINGGESFRIEERIYL